MFVLYKGKINILSYLNPESSYQRQKIDHTNFFLENDKQSLG